jgi:hypothetical protein
VVRSMSARAIWLELPIGKAAKMSTSVTLIPETATAPDAPRGIARGFKLARRGRPDDASVCFGLAIALPKLNGFEDSIIGTQKSPRPRPFQSRVPPCNRRGRHSAMSRAPARRKQRSSPSRLGGRDAAGV